MKSQPISACVCKAKIRNLGIRVRVGRSATQFQQMPFGTKSSRGSRGQIVKISIKNSILSIFALGKVKISYPKEKIILSRRDMGGDFILFEMAVTWEP